MTTVRKRVLIPIAGDIFVRNFIDSGAFAELEARYEVWYLVSSKVAKPIAGDRVIHVQDDDVDRRTIQRYRTGFLTMRRYRARSRSFDLKYQGTFYRRLSPIRRAAFLALSAPGVCEAVCWATERVLGKLAEVDVAITTIRPAFIIVPSGFSDSFSIDCVKSAKAAGIPSLMLMFNWDNVSCKGLLPVLPDHLGVWGDQTRNQAVAIHRMPASEVFLLGAPQFELYRQADISESERIRDVRMRNGVPDDKLLLLYLGISRYRDEIALLSILEQAITDGRLPGTHVVYRPHPWREVSRGERNFFDRSFQHVTMDEQLREHYVASLTDPGYNVKRFVPDYGYYPFLLTAADAVVSSLTTMGIEAMLVGKPVLLPAYPEPGMEFSVDTLIQYDHHDCWEQFRDAIVCHRQEDFVSDAQRLIAFARDPDVGHRTRRDVQYVVYADDVPYPVRLCRLVDRLTASARPNDHIAGGKHAK